MIDPEETANVNFRINEFNRKEELRELKEIIRTDQLLIMDLEKRITELEKKGK